MYDMYPDWGPARHRHPDQAPLAEPTRRPRYWEREPAAAGAGRVPVATATRDASGDRPDDN